jgi:hypothetical protein
MSNNSSKGRSHHQKEAYKATQQYQNQNPQPPGVQIHHLNKVLDAEKANMPTQTMNQNLLPLQSHSDKPATTLHVDPKGGGTSYTVHKEVKIVNDDRKNLTAKNVNRDLSKPIKSYGTEHRAADKYLHKKADGNIRQANPNISDSDRIEGGGATVRWQLTGRPGKVSPHVAQEVKINEGEHFSNSSAKPAPGNPNSGPSTANAGQQSTLSSNANPKAVAEWGGAQKPVNPGKAPNSIAESGNAAKSGLTGTSSSNAGRSAGASGNNPQSTQTRNANSSPRSGSSNATTPRPTATPSGKSASSGSSPATTPRPTPISSSRSTSSGSSTSTTPRPTPISSSSSAGATRGSIGSTSSGKATAGSGGGSSGSIGKATGASGGGSAMGPRGGPGVSGGIAH